MSITMGGMFSGMDTTSLIDQLIAIQRAPITTLNANKDTLDQQSEALGFLNTSLSTLKTNLQSLGDTALYRAKAVSISDSTIGSATVDDTAAATSIKLEITQVASASVLKGGSASSPKTTKIYAGSENLETVLNDTAIAGKKFAINSVQIELTDDMSIDGLVSAINSNATLSSLDIKASYDSGTGKFNINSPSGLTKPILGSPADTSDFLQKAQLFNNNLTALQGVTSQAGIGRLDLSKSLEANPFATAVPASSSGTISVNGVEVSYSSTDSLQTVLDNITASDAGVVANYDSFDDKIMLTSKSRGSLGISVSDVSGNLAQALKLGSADTDSSSLILGASTKFKVDGGTERESSDEILDSSELGVSGLSFTAIKTTDTDGLTLTIGADKASVKSAIDKVVEQYNSLQNMIASYIKVDPNDSSKNGALANNTALTYLPSDLRMLIGAPYTTGTYRMLEDLGVAGNGTDNTLTLSDSSKLDDALENNLDEVIQMFTDSSSGLTKMLGDRVDAYTSTLNGVIVNQQNSITKQQSYIDDEIERIETQAAAEKKALQAQFAAMEEASANASKLSQFFKTSSS